MWILLSLMSSDVGLNLTEEERQMIRELFDRFDKEKTGFIDTTAARTSQNMRAIVEPLGKISFEDLLANFAQHKENEIRKGSDKGLICAFYVKGMRSSSKAGLKFRDRVSEIAPRPQ